MKCTVCSESMDVKKEDYSTGEGKKKYKRTIYWCKHDDVWITTETPEQKNIA